MVVFYPGGVFHHHGANAKRRRRIDVSFTFGYFCSFYIFFILLYFSFSYKETMEDDLDGRNFDDDFDPSDGDDFDEVLFDAEEGDADEEEEVAAEEAPPPATTEAPPGDEEDDAEDPPPPPTPQECHAAFQMLVRLGASFAALEAQHEAHRKSLAYQFHTRANVSGEEVEEVEFFDEELKEYIKNSHLYGRETDHLNCLRGFSRPPKAHRKKRSRN